MYKLSLEAPSVRKMVACVGWIWFILIPVHHRLASDLHKLCFYVLKAMDRKRCYFYFSYQRSFCRLKGLDKVCKSFFPWVRFPTTQTRHHAARQQNYPSPVYVIGRYFGTLGAMNKWSSSWLYTFHLDGWKRDFILHSLAQASKV